MIAPPLLSCRDLVVAYRTPHGPVRAVDGVSLDIEPGQTVGLVGESGSGKSSLGRALIGLERPAAGEVRISGKVVSNLGRRAMRPYRRIVQMIFQDPFGSLNPRLTIGHIVAEPMTVNGIGTPRERAHKVAGLLERVGLDPAMAGRLPHEFSGGQRQRVMIARALALDPALIICDEPVSALDVSVQAQVLNLLADLQRDLGVAYLFISHDLSVVRHIAHRVAVMYLGQIVSDGGRRTFWQEPAHPYTRRLLAASPTMHGAGIVAQPDDEIPSASNPPSGCRFRTRCEFAEPPCGTQRPPLKVLRPGDHSACLRVDSDGQGRIVTPWSTPRPTLRVA